MEGFTYFINVLSVNLDPSTRPGYSTKAKILCFNSLCQFDFSNAFDVEFKYDPILSEIITYCTAFYSFFSLLFLEGIEANKSMIQLHLVADCDLSTPNELDIYMQCMKFKFHTFQKLF